MKFMSQLKMSKIILIIILNFLIFKSSYGDNDKKIIYSGWDNKDTKYIKENWEEMEKNAPFFDGIGILVRPDEGGTDLGWLVGSNKLFTFEQFKEAIENMKEVKFKKFSENFLTTQWSSYNSLGLHWFNDQRWNIFLNNLEVLTKIAKEIKAKGLIIDLEHYEYYLFNYKFMNENYYKASWDEYSKKAFQRGVETIQTINKIYPDITLFFYRAWSYPLKNYKYRLLIPFLDGMLSASTPETIFIDGFEDSYGYKKEGLFVIGKNLIKYIGKNFVKYPEKFEKQVKIGFGLWLDYQNKWEIEPEKIKMNYFSPIEWSKTLNYALKHTDKYVWIYSQQAKFFQNFNIPQNYLDIFFSLKKVKQENF